MKRYFLFLFFVFFVLNSCNSSDETYVDLAAQNSLRGRWNWVSKTGGINGITSTPASENISVVIEFSGSTYKKYINGKVAFVNKFFVVRQPSIYGGESKMIILIDSNSSTNNQDKIAAFGAQSYDIVDNKLYLRDEHADGYISEYEYINQPY